jgi:hypothetical protein
MGQMSVQYTPVQVLQAARRAEAEGKMDYALQFYRHLVENHGQTAEAQEAREGLFRIAEWRWGEGRAPAPARQSSAPAAQPNYPQQYAAAVSPQSAPADYAPEPPAHLPQVIAREAAAKAAQAEGGSAADYQERYRGAKIVAFITCGLGFVGVAAGVVVSMLAAFGGVAGMSAGGLLGLPVGVLLGVPTAVVGLVLVIAGQLAAAVFESTNATLELVAMGRDRLGV